jgi:hypothetical protein
MFDGFHPIMTLHVWGLAFAGPEQSARRRSWRNTAWRYNCRSLFWKEQGVLTP